MRYVRKTMDKLFGSDIDAARYDQLTNSYIEFVKAYSPLLDEAEKINQDLLACKCFMGEKAVEDQEFIINCMVDTLTSMVPLFVKFSSLMEQLKEKNSSNEN